MADLFTQTKSLSHRNDPETSREAADRMVKSGKLSRQETQVHRVIYERFWNRDFTARQLAFGTGLDYYTIQRRLSGLRNKGKIERTGEKRDGCCVWRLKGK